jgi:hypothetical protein
MHPSFQTVFSCYSNLSPFVFKYIFLLVNSFNLNFQIHFPVTQSIHTSFSNILSCYWNNSNPHFDIYFLITETIQPHFQIPFPVTEIIHPSFCNIISRYHNHPLFPLSIYHHYLIRFLVCITCSANVPQTCIFSFVTGCAILSSEYKGRLKPVILITIVHPPWFENDFLLSYSALSIPFNGICVYLAWNWSAWLQILYQTWNRANK